MKLFKKITSLFNKKEQVFVNEKKIEEVELKRELRMVEEEEGSLKIFYGDNLIINNNEKNPFIEVLRGTFDIKDGKVNRQFRKIIPIHKVKADKVLNFIKLEFADKGYRVNVLIKENENKLEINLDGKENYEYINLNFRLGENERLFGLGELPIFNLNGNNILNYPNFGKKRIFDAFKKDTSIKSSLNTSNLIYNDKGYLINVDSIYPTEFSFKNNMKISFNKRPYKIEFFFDNDIDNNYKKLNENGRNRQKLLTRYIKGIIVQESIKKIEKTLNKANRDGIEINSILLKETNIEDFAKIFKAKEIANKYSVNLLLKVAPMYEEGKFLVEKFKEYIDKVNEFANGYYLTFKDSVINELNEITEIKRTLIEKTTSLDNKIMFCDCNVSCETLEFITINNKSETLEDFKNGLLSNSLGGLGLSTAIIENKGLVNINKETVRLAELATFLPVTIIGNYSIITNNMNIIKQHISVKEELRPYYINIIGKANKGYVPLLTSDFYKMEAVNKIYLSDLIEIDVETLNIRVKKDKAWVDFPHKEVIN